MNTKDHLVSGNVSTERALDLALEALEWMVANDDTNEGDEPVERLGGQSWNEYNAYWIDGLNKARAAITAIKQARSAQPAPVQEPVQEPDYAWPTIADYEKEVGFAVNDTFKAAWQMARTTNDLFTRMGNT